MSSPFISLIIPVYNTRKYILQCLESVRNQTFSDYEAIWVDDGSPDDSAQIIEQFIADNGLTNFHLVHKENGGLCSARNFGTQLAKGQWIAHVDSDDWIETEYLSRMASAVKETDADFCLIGFRAYDENTGRFDVWSDYPLSGGTLPEDMPALTSFDYTWARMYKKSIIDAHNLSFDGRIKHCEDNAFNFDYIRFVKKFVCVSDVGYNYRRNVAGSLTKATNSPLKRVHIFEHMEGFVNSFAMEDIVATLNGNWSFSRIMWNVLLNKVTCHILTKNAKEARRYIKTDLAQAIISAHHPRSKKDHVFHFLLKHAFPLLALLIRVYYGNLSTLVKFRRLFHFFSH